ncbi:MAG: ABC transporter permease, partial [Lachnospiraceae bacterium]|nr:ABC transporter permease [Lachnospiraceae bacterium]
IIDLAVSYVQNMESVKSICRLEAVTEQEGKQLLENGELSALIVLPKDVINEILSGSNTPAVLYLPDNSNKIISDSGLSAVGSMLFEELASAGMGMLVTAQAEIYASSAILQELAIEVGTDGFLQSIYDDINEFNLRTVANREKLFRTKTLSLTENDTYAVYYGSALMTIYVMLAGLFFGEFCKRSSLQQTMADKRIGVGYAVQLTARWLAGSMLMLVVFLLPALVYFIQYLIPQADRLLTIKVTGQGVVSLFVIILFMTMYYMMIYQMIEKRESALVVIGIFAVLGAYLSGCLIPSVLLPKVIRLIGEFLPSAMIKKGFTIWVTGETQKFSYVVVGLCIWGMLLFLGTMLSMYIGELNGYCKDRIQRATKVHVPSLGMVLFRRLLHRKSIWISLVMIVLASALILEGEKKSETQIMAAVYDETGDSVKLLNAYEGLVRFKQYDSDEAVQNAVQKGDVACGYVLSKMLKEDMTVMNAERKILVYQNADAVAVPVVNEILFERLFQQVSLKWFEDYMIQNSAAKELGIDENHIREIVKDSFNRELLAGTTFHIDVKRMGIESSAAKNNDNHDVDENRAVYPVYVVATIAVILCALQGIVQVITDIREHNFYKQNRLAVSALTVILPILFGVACAFLIILSTTHS